jgi:N-acetylmuramoyl-L-alanine amidase
MTFQPDSPLVSALHPSGNFGERRDGLKPDILVLHYTGVPAIERALELLSSPAAQVSSHYVVAEDGSVIQMVPEAMRAWHAGVSSWKGITDINSCSIGIEIQNPGHDLGYPDFPPAQIESVIGLCRDICARWQIRPERVLAHSDVAPRRKIDPGEKFPWRALWQAGVGHWADVQLPAPGTGELLREGSSGEAVTRLQSAFRTYGYGLEVSGAYDEETGFVVAAFQRHFRPAAVDGVADLATRYMLDALIAALPAREA